MHARSFKNLLIISIAATSLFAAGSVWSAMPDTAQTVEQAELEQARTQRELEFTRVKHLEAAEKLNTFKQELAARKAQLEATRSRLGEDASSAELELLKNEQNRLAVAELSLQSQQSQVERLARKQSELQDRLSGTQSDLIELKAAIEAASDREAVAAKRKAQAEKQELEQLRRDNAQLKTSLEHEQSRLTMFEMRVEELVRLNDLKDQQIASLQQTVAQLSQPAPQPVAEPEPATAAKDNQTNLDLSTTVLDGEAPIYQGEDGEEIIMRSRNLEQPVAMTQIGPSLYQVDVTLEPGKAYFDLLRRRYRGTFNESATNEYRFWYDLSNEEKPRLYVQALPTEDAAMATNASPDF